MLIKLVTVFLGLCAVGLTQDLPAINPEGLNPDASHVCSSTIKEYYSQYETYIQYVQKKTYTWCFAIPPRCTQYHTVKETRTRLVTKSRNRKSYFCCQGYESQTGINYCIAKCQDRCNQNGICILPETCRCYDGFVGMYCDSNCTAGFWGPDCAQSCQCSDHGACDPQNGNCICHVGYTGTDCSTPCQGAFGLHCMYPCSCENNATCDIVDGHCTCQPGYYGVYCDRVCAPGTPVEECQQECQCQNGGQCRNGSREDCICPPGYIGQFCTETCDSTHWGINCSQSCICYSGLCDPESGLCRCDMGFGGEHCQTECDPGFYGRDCRTECACEHDGVCYYSDAIRTVSCNCTGTGYHGSACHNRDCQETEYLVAGQCETCDCPWATTSSCDVLTGKCQCMPGYQGDQCEEECQMPFYGGNCSEVCECPHGDCHFITGECTRCYPGYLGANCDVKCPTGTWGLNCTQQCACQNGARCHHNTGYCNCTLGFYGLYCAQRCPEGTYGFNCEEECDCNNETAICNPADGHCQCLSGYHGDRCDDRCPLWWYGFQCASECSCRENGTASCDHRTGECRCKAGWRGVTCDSRCYEGTWGENCLETCHCNQHGSCDQSSGDCICHPGYIGPYCSQECPQGRYGFGCQETCLPCSDGAVCDFVTGECPPPGVCPPGFTGETCEEVCPDGFWGEGCANECAETCGGDRGRCNPINGRCRCFPGYRGVDCEHMCEAGTYGVACQEECRCDEVQTETCDHKSGHCTCLSGFTGPLCEVVVGVGVTGQQEGGEPAGGVSPVIIAVVAIAVVLIIIIILIVIYYGRRVRKLKEDNLQVQFSVSRSGTFDNSPSANHMEFGVVNPTYDAENLNNEARYPHLSSRAPAPPPAASKLDSCAADRRTSGCYEDPEEDRYTTLKNVSDEPTGYDNSSDVNIQRPNYESKVSDKYVFYTGPKVPNTTAERLRLPSSSYDQGERRDDDSISYLKPNNLDLAQQTTIIADPSPRTSSSTVDEEPEQSNQASEDQDPDSLALQFVNTRFQSATRVKEPFNDTANPGEMHSPSNGLEQSLIANEYTPTPHLSTVSADTMGSTSSNDSTVFTSSPTNQALMSSTTNPYDTPLTREQQSEEAKQGTLSNGYLTPKNSTFGGTSNQYDTPRTPSLPTSPYDTPRSLKHPTGDVDDRVEADKITDMGEPPLESSVGSANENDPSERENWIAFDDSKIGSRQSVA